MSASPDPCLCVRDLAKHYGPVEAVRGLSFDLVPGEIFGLLGPNGAGKTTTLECILGLRHPDAGTITVDGIDAIAHPERAKERVGAQIQPTTLQDQITPREALQFFAAFYRQPAAIADLLAQFALTEKADAPFHTLSAGQKQRLAVALAFVNRPRLVVLDEPTAGLDPLSRRDLHRSVQAMRAAGCAVLLSTHYLEEAHQLCDRVAILHRGKIVALAPPEELIARARALPQVAVRTGRALTREMVKELPGVTACETTSERCSLRTSELNRTIVELTRQLESSGNPLLELQIHRPSLEDVFIELTGETWVRTEEEKP
jgi:ABC-2 type transport system ATP-binding protein